MTVHLTLAYRPSAASLPPWRDKRTVTGTQSSIDKIITFMLLIHGKKELRVPLGHSTKMAAD